MNFPGRVFLDRVLIGPAARRESRPSRFRKTGVARGARARTDVADYMLVHRNTELAVVEASRRCEEKDFNGITEIREREKTLVFCATQAHAQSVRDLPPRYPILEPRPWTTPA